MNTGPYFTFSSIFSSDPVSLSAHAHIEGGCHHVHKPNLDNPSQAHPEARLLGGSRFCHVVVYIKNHIHYLSSLAWGLFFLFSHSKFI